MTIILVKCPNKRGFDGDDILVSINEDETDENALQVKVFRKTLSSSQVAEDTTQQLIRSTPSSSYNNILINNTKASTTLEETYTITKYMNIPFSISVFSNGGK